MLISGTVIDALGVATLILVGLLFCVGLFSVGYVLHFRHKIHKTNSVAFKDFNSLWVVRLILITFGTLWGVGELIRLPLLRREGWLLHKLGYKWQANMCRFYIVSSLGLVEPCFFLTALFLVYGSIRDEPFTPRRRWNSKVVALVLGFCAPIFCVQAFLAVISSNSKLYGESNNGYAVFPHYFTTVFEEAQVDGQHTALCAIPLFSTMALGIFATVYIVYFLYLGSKMLSLVINKRLQLRLYGLILVLLFLLPVHITFLGLSVLPRPSEPLFEAIAFMGFVTVLLCIMVGEGILVIRPISDALAVNWIFEGRSKQYSQDVNPKQFVLPLAAVGIEGDMYSYPVSGKVMNEAAEMLVHSSNISGKERSILLQGTGFIQDNSFYGLSPSASPNLPGKTLTSQVHRLFL